MDYWSAAYKNRANIVARSWDKEYPYGQTCYRLAPATIFGPILKVTRKLVYSEHDGRHLWSLSAVLPNQSMVTNGPNEHIILCRGIVKYSQTVTIVLLALLRVNGLLSLQIQ